MDETRIFRMSVTYCVFMTVAIFLGVAIGTSLSGQGISLPVLIGITIGVGGALAFQKLKVSPEMVSYSRKKFRFADGTVTMEKLSPGASWLRFGYKDGSAIVFTPKDGGKVQKIYFPLAKPELAELETLIQKYNAAS